MDAGALTIESLLRMAAEAGHKLKSAPAPRPPAPPQARFAGLWWMWVRTQCRCGRVYEAPMHSEPFAKWVLPGPTHRTEYRRLSQGYGLTTDPVQFEWTEREIPACPACATQNLTLDLPLQPVPGQYDHLAVTQELAYRRLLLTPGPHADAATAEALAADLRRRETEDLAALDGSAPISRIDVAAMAHSTPLLAKALIAEILESD